MDEKRIHEEFGECGEQMWTKFKQERKAWERYNSDWFKCLMFIARVIFFPIMLLVRLFRWTYHYED